MKQTQDARSNLIATFKRWRHHLLGPLLALIVIGILVFLPTKDYFITTLTWIQDQGAIGLLWIILLYALACVLFFPKTIIALSAGFLFGMTAGFFTAFCGCAIGASITFFISRGLSKKWRTKFLSRASRFQKIASAINQEGFKIILLCRLNPIFPFGFMNYIAGTTSVTFIKYISASLLGFIPLLLLYVYLGQTAKTLIAAVSSGITELPKPHFILLAFVLLALGLSFFTISLIRRALRKSVPDTDFL